MTTTISPARPDSPEAVALIGELDHYLNQLYPAESNYGLSIDALLDETISFYLVRCDGVAAGCGGVQFFGAEYAELKRMYIRPAYRGLGLGRQLLAQLEALVRERGVTLLRLETGLDQPEALGLYERSGYRRIGPFGRYQSDPLSLFYEKNLAAKA